MGDFWREPMIIGGKTVITEDMTQICNPARVIEQIGEVPVGTEKHVSDAVEAAARAWPAWIRASVTERAGYLESTARYIEDHLAFLARMLVLENGKLLSEAVAEMEGSIGVLRYYAGLQKELSTDVIRADGRGTMVLTRQAAGVVSVIVPWNAPVQLGFLMIAPGLLAGNCIVAKPSTYAPLTLTHILLHLAQQLPKGVLNVVQGSGSTVGSALITHPKVRKISFTGSTEVGRTIGRQAARTLKNISMELGGNDAAIVLRDADINNRLFQELVKGVFGSAGQICYAVKRIYVHQEIYDTFLDGFIAACAEIRVGSGLNPTASMCPLNNKNQFRQVTELIEQTESAGAVVRAVGAWADDTNPLAGYFMLPRVVHGIDQQHPLVQDEQFGPVIPVLPFETEEEAVALANDTEFGLGNSIWTRDVEHGFELAKRLQSGSVFLNVHRVGASAADMPFGGFKQSGIGRGHSVEGLHEHTELQAIIHRIDM